MQCKEFTEISEAYLSDELLVETNIQVLGHLKKCTECQERFENAVWWRQRLGSSIRNSEEFRIDPDFAKRLTSELRERSSHQPLMSGLLRTQIAVPIFASILIVALFGFAIMNQSVRRALLSTQPVVESVAHMIAEVVGHHRTCAVAKLNIWEQLARADEPDEEHHRETILKPLRESLGNSIELLHSDDCLFEGKPFVHIILKDGENVVSVFLAKPGPAANDADDLTDSVQSTAEAGFWIATFRARSQRVFVVSDLPEAENRNIATALLDAWMKAPLANTNGLRPI